MKSPNAGAETRASTNKGHGKDKQARSFAKIIAIGGSAGGISSLCAVLKNLPLKFPSPILAVIHMGEGSTHLPEVLQNCTKLKVVTAEPAERLAPGKVYVPLPNRHITVRDGCVGTDMGPRESRHRPSVDTLFRSVARAYRSNVIAVVLSGVLDDGSAGAAIIKARGGTLIIEDPATARFPGMPNNVRDHAKVDYCVEAADIGILLTELVTNGSQARKRKKHKAGADCEETFGWLDRRTEPQGISCPECGGVLAQTGEGKAAWFRCHVGHSFSLKSLTAAQTDTLERAIWMALRQLNERRMIYEGIVRANNDPSMKDRCAENVQTATEDIKRLQEILRHL